MSLIDIHPSKTALQADGHSHISTLASSSTAAEPVVWKKSTPLKTYSKKTVSPVPPLLVTLSQYIETDTEDKSRYGRARKLIPCGDFLSTDRQVSQYLKIQTENQFHNFRATYSNSKVRSTPKKHKVPPKSAAQNPNGSFSMTFLPKPEGNGDAPKMSSVLDLAAPTCTETVETPLPLQECESDSDSDSMAPHDYSVGDLVWAAVPSYPYWPAMITRDPVSSLPYKIHGSGRSTRTLWHVHFFGDKGMRGWVVTRNTFIFDGLDSYNNARAEFQSKIKHMGKKKQKTLNKAYTIPNNYGKSWVAAVSEAQSLLASSRSDRLEYLITAYAPKIETLKKRQRALSLCDLNMIAKKPRMSEPPHRRKSLVAKTPEAVHESSLAEPVKAKIVVRAIPTEMPKSAQKLLQSLTSVESSVPYSLPVDNTVISPKSEASGEPSQPPLPDTPIVRRSLGKKKSVENKSVQRRPKKSDLPGYESDVTVSEEHQVKTEDKSEQNVLVTTLLSPTVEDSSTVSKEVVSDLTTSATGKKKRGRPRKYPVTAKEEPVKKSPRKSTSKKSPPKKAPPVQAVSVTPEKRSRGRPRKSSLPTPSKERKCTNTITPKSAKSQTRSSILEPSPTITRSGRQSNKPVLLSMLTSPKGRKQEPNTSYYSSTAAVLIKQEPTSPTRVKIESGPPATPKTKRKRLSEKEKKKKVKLEPDGEYPVDESLVKEEPASPDDLSKPTVKAELAAKAPIREIQRIQQSKKISLFAGVKDGKVCSICYKGGQGVKRCRGPCSLYMHEECSTKPRFVPDCDTAQDGAKRTKKKSRKQLLVDTKKSSLESSNEQDKTASAPGVCSVEINLPNGMAENSVSTTEYEINKVEAVIGDDDSSMENQIKEDSGLLNGPTSCESLLRNPTNIVSESDTCLNNICMFSGKPASENNVEEEELIIHMGEQDSFPESSGIPTPPPEDNSKSPKTNSAAIMPLKLEHVEEELAMPGIKADLGNFPIDSSESMTSDASEREKNDASRREAKDKAWVCNMCQESNLGPCFACGKDDGDRVRCKAGGMCGKVFHLECTKEWPQHTKKHTATGKLVFNCPAHTCHTCISDNPASLTSRYLNDKLVRCMRCPTTYHHGNFCVPAGSEILSSTQIICPRHFRQGKKSLSPVNASWCFLCSMGGSLICCDLCPNSFHVECLKISPPEGAYICEDCETGRFPLYGEIVWAKLGNYRWWPARILFPLEIPASLQRVEHVPGEFVVRFYGTYNYYWLHRGRVFLFHEGDGKKRESISLHSKKHSEGVFNRGVEEANTDFIIWTGERNRREETQRISLKPPKYVKITSNRPVGSVKMNEADSSSITACYCKPDQEDPCGPESDCINRLLLVECSPQICPAREKCNNQNFEKRLYPPLAPFRTEYRGWGLKTLGPLKKGDFIIEYVGEMIDEDEYKRRLLEMQRSKDENFYFLTLDKDRMLDAGPKGNLSRFMNHSCQPNCETQKWTVEGNMRVGLFALQDIPADSELVFNYNLMTTGASKLECRCGAPTCASFIGGKPSKPPTKSKDVASKSSAAALRQRGKKKKKTRRKKSLAKVALTNSSGIGASTKAPPKKDEVKCFACHEIGATVACQDARCPQMYHLACLGFSKDPLKGWTCPWHDCSVCGSQNMVANCSFCINAYCSDHHEGNIVFNRGKGSLCHNHNMSDSGSDWSTGEKDEDGAEGRISQGEIKPFSRR